MNINLTRDPIKDLEANEFDQFCLFRFGLCFGSWVDITKDGVRFGFEIRV